MIKLGDIIEFIVEDAKVSNAKYALVDFDPKYQNSVKILTTGNDLDSMKRKSKSMDYGDIQHLRVIGLRAPVYIGDLIDRRRASELVEAMDPDEVDFPIDKRIIAIGQSHDPDTGYLPGGRGPDTESHMANSNIRDKDISEGFLSKTSRLENMPEELAYAYKMHDYAKEEVAGRIAKESELAKWGSIREFIKAVKELAFATKAAVDEALKNRVINDNKHTKELSTVSKGMAELRALEEKARDAEDTQDTRFGVYNAYAGADNVMWDYHSILDGLTEAYKQWKSTVKKKNKKNKFVKTEETDPNEVRFKINPKIEKMGDSRLTLHPKWKNIHEELMVKPSAKLEAFMKQHGWIINGRQGYLETYKKVDMPDNFIQVSYGSNGPLEYRHSSKWKWGKDINSGRRSSSGYSTKSAGSIKALPAYIRSLNELLGEYGGSRLYKDERRDYGKLPPSIRRAYTSHDAVTRFTGQIGWANEISVKRQISMVKDFAYDLIIAMKDEGNKSNSRLDDVRKYISRLNEYSKDVTYGNSFTLFGKVDNIFDQLHGMLDKFWISVSKTQKKSLKEDGEAPNLDVTEPFDDKDIEYQKHHNDDIKNLEKDPDEVDFEMDPRVKRIARGGMGRQPRTSSKFDNISAGHEKPLGNMY